MEYASDHENLDSYQVALPVSLWVSAAARGVSRIVFNGVWPWTA
jgi:hypothetical protein